MIVSAIMSHKTAISRRQKPCTSKTLCL